MTLWTSKLANKKRKSAPILKVLPPTTEAFDMHFRCAHFQAPIWWSPLKPDPPLPSHVNMDGHWISQHKFCTQFHCLLMCHLHH